jgi:3-methyladenine DNA glycosylase/8-oxoguanine DNA glycosylase
MPERSISIDGPLDLRATLEPLHGKFDGKQGWWLTARTKNGPATLLVSRTSQSLRGEAWGDGAGDLLERLGRIGGLADDPSSFRTAHVRVRELHRRRPGLRFGYTSSVFDELVIAIVGQKVTGTEAARAMSGLRQAFSGPAPGPNPELRLPPNPEAIAAAPYWQFHELHLEQKRSEVLIRAAKSASEIDGLANVSPAVAAARLRQIRGIGEWSVAETLVRSHGDADQVSVGDFHLKNLVVYHLTGRPRGSDEEMLELLEEFRPHRARVVRLLHSLGHAPKYGPRTKPRNITSF